MGKKSKHPVYDDPTAFSKHWPKIREVSDVNTLSGLIRPERVFKMGKITASVTEPTGNMGYFMTVRCTDRYPTWDEIVWMRYNLIPDAAVMSMRLPNLNRYINQEDTGHKFVFTMEQTEWAIDPPPYCDHCKSETVLKETAVTTATMICPNPRCQQEQTIDLMAWNEQHGNGFNAEHTKELYRGE